MNKPRYLYDLVQQPNCPDPADPSCEWMSRDVLEAMSEDDVSGSGIFDVTRPSPMEQHIFSGSRGALPGYAARERGDGPSEAIDQQTGTPTRVFLPGWRDGQRMLPSTQPRYPYPDPSLLMGDARELAMNGLGTIEVGNEWEAGGFSTMPTTRLFGWSGNPPPAVYGQPGEREIYDASQAGLPVPPGQQGSIRPFPAWAPTPIGRDSIEDATLARRGIPTRPAGTIVNPAPPLVTGRVGDRDISNTCDYSNPINRRLYEVPLRPQLSSVLLPVPTIPLDQPCPAYVGRVPVAPPPAVVAPPRPANRFGLMVPKTPGGTAAEVIVQQGGDINGGGVFATPGSIFTAPKPGGGSIFSAPPKGPGPVFTKTPKGPGPGDFVVGPKPPGSKGPGPVFTKTPKGPGPGDFVVGPKPPGSKGPGLFVPKGTSLFAPGPGIMVSKSPPMLTGGKPKCRPGFKYDPKTGLCVDPSGKVSYDPGGGGASYVPGAWQGKSKTAGDPGLTIASGGTIFSRPGIFSKTAPATATRRPSPRAGGGIFARPGVSVFKPGSTTSKAGGCGPGEVFNPRTLTCEPRGGLWSTAPRGTFARPAGAAKAPSMFSRLVGGGQGKVVAPRPVLRTPWMGGASLPPRPAQGPFVRPIKVKVPAGYNPARTKGRPPPPPKRPSPLLRNLKLSGLGSDDDGGTTPLWQWVVGGVVLGAAAAVAVSYVGGE